MKVQASESHYHSLSIADDVGVCPADHLTIRSTRTCYVLGSISQTGTQRLNPLGIGPSSLVVNVRLAPSGPVISLKSMPFRGPKIGGFRSWRKKGGVSLGPDTRPEEPL